MATRKKNHGKIADSIGGVNITSSNKKETRTNRKKLGELKKSGLNRKTIPIYVQALLSEIQDIKEAGLENTPSIQKIYHDIPDLEGLDFDNMTKGDYIKVATAVRSFMSAEDSSVNGAKKMYRMFAEQFSSAYSDPFTQREGEKREDFLKRRKEYISLNEGASKAAFALYRKISERQAANILRELNPAAYGSENLIVDLFQYVEEMGLTKSDVEDEIKIGPYIDSWVNEIERIERSNMRELKRFGESADLKFSQFKWRRTQEGSFYGR